MPHTNHKRIVRPSRKNRDLDKTGDATEATRPAEFEPVIVNVGVNVGINDDCKKLDVSEVSTIGPADTPKTLVTTAGEKELV